MQGYWEISPEAGFQNALFSLYTSCVWVCHKESTWNAGDMGSIPESMGSIPGGGHGNPLQYSCLENPMDRGAWPATVHGATKSQT